MVANPNKLLCRQSPCKGDCGQGPAFPLSVRITGVQCEEFNSCNYKIDETANEIAHASELQRLSWPSFHGVTSTGEWRPQDKQSHWNHPLTIYFSHWPHWSSDSAVLYSFKCCAISYSADRITEERPSIFKLDKIASASSSPQRSWAIITCRQVQRLWVKSMVVHPSQWVMPPIPTGPYLLLATVWSFVNSPWQLKSSLPPLPPSSLCKCLQALAERSHKRRSGLKRSLCSGSIGLGLGVLNILLRWGEKNTKTLHKSVSCKPVCPKTRYARNQQVI